MMDAFRVFDSIYVTTGGGPAGATDTLMVLAVKRGLQFFDIGSAAAIGNVMILCLGVIAGTLRPGDPAGRPRRERSLSEPKTAVLASAAACRLVPPLNGSRSA